MIELDFIHRVNRENKDIIIDRIALSETGILFVKPKDYTFEMIYRSAKGVHWDSQRNCLYHNAPQKWDALRWYEQIVSAVKDEYGGILKISPETIYVNIDDSLKNSLENFQE